MIADYSCTDEPGGSGLAPARGRSRTARSSPTASARTRSRSPAPMPKATWAPRPTGTSSSTTSAARSRTRPSSRPDGVIPIILELGRRPQGPSSRPGTPLGARRELCDRRSHRTRRGRQRTGQPHEQRTSAPPVAHRRRLGRFVPIARGPARLQRLVGCRCRVHGPLRLSEPSPTAASRAARRSTT